MAAFKMIRLLMFLKEVVRYTQCTYLYKYFTLLCVIHKRNIRLALRLIQVFTCKIIWCDYSVNLGITKSSPPTILKLIHGSSWRSFSISRVQQCGRPHGAKMEEST